MDFLRSSRLLTFGMASFASKTLVYLAAALIPLQPLAVSSCNCDSHGQHDVDANPCEQQAKLESGCCQRDDDCRCSRHSQANSCCTETHPAPAKSCCETGGACSCGADNSSPPVPPVPRQSRGYSVNDGAQPLVIALFSPEDDPRSVPCLSTDHPRGASGLAKCIVLCRFRL